MVFVMTKEEFHRIHNYRVSEDHGKYCMRCVHCKTSDRPIKFTRWPGDGEYYPSYSILCTYIGRPIKTGYLCVCDMFDK